MQGIHSPLQSFKRIVFVLGLISFAFLTQAQPLKSDSPVEATLLGNTSALVPGEKFTVGVLLKMAPGWHTYFREPGDSGLPTKIKWELPEGFSAGEIQWPKPVHKVEPGGIKANIYNNEVLLITEITPPSVIADPQVNLRAHVKWLACKDSCIPDQADLSLPLPVAKTASPANVELFDKYRAQLEKGRQVSPSPLPQPAAEVIPARVIPASQQMSSGTGLEVSVPPLPANIQAAPQEIDSKARGIWGYLFFAFLGGLILNVMPCVLPVIALKLLGFIKYANESPRRIRALGLWYALGVFCSFLLLAGVVVGAQSAGNLIGWGMQFQNPIFVVAMTILVTLVSLNLFGLFEITLGGSTLGAVSSLAGKQGGLGSFFNGIFAVVLATPCTAPFLGAALGFAFLQPPLVIFLFFSAIAAGLALPYLLICSFPSLFRFLPKPGLWMERFKVALGFPMLATAVWLFEVASRHYGTNTVWLGVFLVAMALAAWIYGEFVQRGRRHRVWAMATALVLLVGAYGFALENRLHWRMPGSVSGLSGLKAKDGTEGIDWQPWSPQAVELARSQGRPVLVDFTADWCLTCQTNKLTSLEIPSVRETLKSGSFVALMADYTRKDDAITQELKKFKRAGVPLVVVYPSTGSPLVLPELLRPEVVLKSLEKAKTGTQKQP